MKRALKNLVIMVISLSLGLATAPAQTRKALTFDDFIKIKRVTDPQLAPDGKNLALVITAMSLETNRGNSDIYLVPATGGTPVPFVFSPAADFFPRWSPDGRTLAFISTRGGSPQVWLIPAGGGEARKVTDFPGGVGSFSWSRSGKFLLVTSSVFPECPDLEANRKKFEEREVSKVKARIYDHLLFRHWNSWFDGTRSHLFLFPLDGGKPLDLTPGDYDTPPIALGGELDFCLAPDEKEIALVRNIDPELKLGLGTNNDVFLTPPEGKNLEKLTASRANDIDPKYSPDGRYLAYRAMARPGFEADQLDLILYDRQNKTFTNLTEKLDYSLSEFLWAPDGKAIYFLCEEKARTALFRVTLSGGKIEKILEGHYLSALRISPDGRTIYALKQAINHPNDVYSIDLASRKLRQLTDVNAGLLAGLEMNAAEDFWFESEGDRVHGLLLKPPFFDPNKKYPLVMLIHGGPQGAWLDNFHYRWNAQMFAAPGYVVAMVNFHGSTGYGQAFTDSISGDWGGKPYRDLIKAVGYLHGTYPFIDRDRLGAAGASYGGYMIDWIGGQTDIFDCLISHSGVFDLRSEYGATEELWFPEWEYRGTPWTNPEMYQKFSPSYYVQNFKTPTLVIHSANDFRVPLEQGLQFFTSLQRMGVPSRLLYFPDEDHFIQKPLNARLWWQTVLDWLATYLKK
ncbi:MAG: Alanyl dipeptidyl peptidase [Candidatus Saccharicenans subterraneus]|uniref:Alanyl dipeptidyl peptidase n=1 Tax=Candidatus Saccharicenans subterraneus TaxID=2508984 RepID=A0A3E2BJU3_9BACT|nr:MAG: Alanyl dipeptidyl peptidase [Candidatus Saccharicenans subterraneum]